MAFVATGPTSVEKKRRLTHLGQTNYSATVRGGRLSPREQTSAEKKRMLSQLDQNNYLAPVRGGCLSPWEHYNHHYNAKIYPRWNPKTCVCVAEEKITPPYIHAG